MNEYPQEIKIISNNIHYGKEKSFEVYIDGNKIPRLKRFALDFNNLNWDVKDRTIFENWYTVEQYLKVAEDEDYEEVEK